jgi:hypothetical protein
MKQVKIAKIIVDTDWNQDGYRTMTLKEILRNDEWIQVSDEELELFKKYKGGEFVVIERVERLSLN